MARLTISLPDGLHRALKEAAARRRRTIGDLIEESLGLYGLKDEETVATLLERARRNAGMSEQEALELAVSETRAARRG